MLRVMCCNYTTHLNIVIAKTRSQRECFVHAETQHSLFTCKENLYKTKPEGFGRGPRSSPSMAPNKEKNETHVAPATRQAKTRHPTLVLLGNIPTNHCLAHVYKKSQHVELQKSASRLKPRVSFSPPVADAITPAFWYSPTRFSKKFVLPCKEINSIQSKGLLTPM